MQLGIALTGNFGHFNLLTVVLCIPLLECGSGTSGTVSPVTSPEEAIATATPLPVFSAAIADTVIYYFFGVVGAINLLFNSWCARSWPFWPALSGEPGPPDSPRWARLLVASIVELLRAVSTWRIVHAYGVFPPHSSPPARFVPIFEGSMDGKTWSRYKYKYMTSATTSCPCHIAPFHPRWDHAVFYEAFGLNAHNFSSSLNVAHPYRFSRSTPLHRLAQRLLESPDGLRPVEMTIFGAQGNPFYNTEKRPTTIRVSLYMFTPTTSSEPGVWWEERRIGTQLAPTACDASIWDEWLPSRLELWHPDMCEWRSRSSAAGNARAQRLQQLAASTRTPAPTARDLADPLPRILSGKSHSDKVHKELWETPADAVVTDSVVEEFWATLLPCWNDMVRNASKASNLSKTVDHWEAALMVSGGAESAPLFPATALQERFGRSKFRQFEVVAGMLTTLLFDRYVPLLRAGHANNKEGKPHSAPRSDGTRGLQVEDGSYFQLWLSCQVAVLRGHMVWSSCWSGSDPDVPADVRDSAFARMQTCARATKAEKLALLALFWPATLSFQASKARLSARIISPDNAPKPDDDGLIPGFVHLSSYLSRHFIVKGATREEVEAVEDLPELVFPDNYGFWEIKKKGE